MEQGDLDVAVQEIRRARQETPQMRCLQVGGVLLRAAPHLVEVERAFIVHGAVQVLRDAARLVQGGRDERCECFPESRLLSRLGAQLGDDGQML